MYKLDVEHSRTAIELKLAQACMRMDSLEAEARSAALIMTARAVEHVERIEEWSDSLALEWAENNGSAPSPR